jgi:PilZ domain
MQHALRNTERRDHARLTHVSPAGIRDIRAGATYTARMFNFSSTGFYIESDSLIDPDTEVYIGIQRNISETGSSDYNCYRAIIMWRKELDEDSNFFYGYGLKLVSDHSPKEDCYYGRKPAGNSRNHPRRLFKRPVKFSDEDGVFEGIAEDISPCGVFVSSVKKYRPGQILTLAIPDKNGRDLLISAKVVWSNKEGFGVKFIKKSQKAIEPVS